MQSAATDPRDLQIRDYAEDSTGTLLCRIEAWAIAIQESRSIDEAIEIRDQSELLRQYVRKRNVSIEVINAAAELKIRVERRIGELLRGMPKHNGDPRSHDVTRLSDIGVGKMESSRCQMIASVPEYAFESHISEVKGTGKELTTAGVLRLAERLKVVASCEPEANPPANPRIVGSLRELIDRGERFATIYADPPWRYSNQETRAATDDHYTTMSVEEICAEPVREVADDDAHLHLWTTNGFLFEAERVMKAWGFEVKSCFVWVKPQMGIGNYWRVSHEFLLFGVRGKCPFRARDEISWGTFDRGDHSAKPDEIRQKIERVSPGPYLEMYGREFQSSSLWTVYGNQVRESGAGVPTLLHPTLSRPGRQRARPVV